MYKKSQPTSIMKDLIPEEKSFLSTFDIIILFYNRWLYELRDDIINTFYKNSLRKEFLKNPDSIKCQMIFKSNKSELGYDEHVELNLNNSSFFDFEYYFKNNNNECKNIQMKHKKNFKFYEKFKKQLDSDDFENEMFNIFKNKFEISNFWNFICDKENESWSDSYDFKSEYSEYETLISNQIGQFTQTKVKSTRSKYILTKSMKDQIIKEKVCNENERCIFEALTTSNKDKDEEEFKSFVSDCLAEIAKNENLVNRAKQSSSTHGEDKYMIFQGNVHSSNNLKRSKDDITDNGTHNHAKKAKSSTTFDI